MDLPFSEWYLFFLSLSHCKNIKSEHACSECCWHINDLNMKGPHGMLRVINSNAIFCYKDPPITLLSSQHY